MTDLFPAQPDREVGRGNALALADIAAGVPVETMRARFKAGHYPGASAALIAANVKFRGGK